MRQAAATLVVASLVLIGCGVSETPPGGSESSGVAEADAATGKEIFQRKCGVCHTLADAGTDGTMGPNLDQLSPPAERVKTMIETGGGAMPAELIDGQEAEDVAAYVAEVAGNPAEEVEE